MQAADLAPQNPIQDHVGIEGYLCRECENRKNLGPSFSSPPFIGCSISSQLHSFVATR